MKFLWPLFANPKELIEASAPAYLSRERIAALPPGELKDLATKIEGWLSSVLLPDIPIVIARKLLEEKK